ncbi:DUF1338 domain-containing protein [Maribacter antarcticus]|uniref:DUF1338 domain-containing protein n=1 Tax=Maribacter antarcticus TaxID=505250 RepID=UPI00047D41ED|nr:DUF1338 domain-containing protein [Maribacter antarcticus]
MKFNQNSALDQLMTLLFEPYKKSVSDVQKVSNALLEGGIIASEDEIVNDHIAFRTLGVPHLGIASLENIFLHYGYKKRDYYFFEGKKLNAYWYSPPSPKYPRIFISELRVEDLSRSTKALITKYTAKVTSDLVSNLDLNDPEAVGDFFYKSLWELPSIADYQTLATDSEYAAWVIYNRYYLNHYTISVHELKEGYNTMETFNEFLVGIGIKLNNSGGIIKQSADGLLRQSSSIAKMIEATFMNGKTMEIPGSYVEFAERLPLPEFKHLVQSEVSRIQRRDGFESANADKIFESTYASQTDSKTD